MLENSSRFLSAQSTFSRADPLSLLWGGEQLEDPQPWRSRRSICPVKSQSSKRSFRGVRRCPGLTSPRPTDRAGGRVRIESGKVSLYKVAGQGTPQVGGKYLLFLTRTDQESDYGILTGYELRDGRIKLLDNPGDGHPIPASEGSDEPSFLKQVRAAVANP